MRTFFCRMDDYDAEDEWEAVKACHIDEAARIYAEKCDSDCAGELCDDSSHHSVFVKGADGEIRTFEISSEYIKNFYATEVIPL